MLEAFATPQNLLKFADDVILLLKKQYHDYSVLNLLRNDLAKVEKSISNLLDCMEQGISTASTKNRLEELEEKRSLLTEKILMEQYKEREQVKGRKKLILTWLTDKVEMYKRCGFKDHGIGDSVWGGEAWHEMDIVLE